MLIDKRRFITIKATYPTFHLSVRIWHLQSHKRWLPSVVASTLGRPCDTYVQRSEWPSTSRVILWQWHSTILATNDRTNFIRII